MSKIQIHDAQKEEASYIVQQLIQYNDTKVTNKQEPPFLHINRCIKDGDELIGGIITQLYWNVLQVDVLWVKEEHRNKGYASALLADVENTANEKYDCKLSHLDTFDFQAKALYEKLGYAVFGVLEDCPEGHKRYYMKKKLV